MLLIKSFLLHEGTEDKFLDSYPIVFLRFRFDSLILANYFLAFIYFLHHAGVVELKLFLLFFMFYLVFSIYFDFWLIKIYLICQSFVLLTYALQFLPQTYNLCLLYWYGFLWATIEIRYFYQFIRVLSKLRPQLIHLLLFAL